MSCFSSEEDDNDLLHNNNNVYKPLAGVKEDVNKQRRKSIIAQVSIITTFLVENTLSMNVVRCF